MRYRTISAEVEVDLSEFDDDDLIEELEYRNNIVDWTGNELILAIYNKRRLGQDYQHELDQLIYNSLGKFV